MGVAAIVLGAGQSTRIGGELNKVLRTVGDRPVLGYPLETFALVPDITSIVVVVRKGDERHVAELADRHAPGVRSEVVHGGASRHASEVAGLDVLRDDITSGIIDVVAIHDGARPFATTSLIAALVATARRVGGAVPALDVARPSVRVGAGGGPEVIRPGTFVRMQTPQVFRAGPLLGAYDRVGPDGGAAVDSAQVVEWAGGLEVGVVPGDERNLKVTHRDDIGACLDLLAHWGAGAWRVEPGSPGQR